MLAGRLVTTAGNLFNQGKRAIYRVEPLTITPYLAYFWVERYFAEIFSEIF